MVSLENTDLPIPLAAIKSIIKVLYSSEASTMSEFIKEIEIYSRKLLSAYQNSISLCAGCELFKRFVTRIGGELPHLEFGEFKRLLLERGKNFAEVSRANEIRDRIANLAFHFIQDGSTILIHSYSKVVMGLLLRANEHNRKFSVYVTEARPTTKGNSAMKYLQSFGIPTTLILDSAVGYYMEKVDIVLVGAEGVVENGGIINQIGTYQISVIAKAANKPLYAVAESFKFVRLYPLNQYDLPSNFSVSVNHEKSYLMAGSENTNTDNECLEDPNPFVDYTPPSYISLLFTDIGVLTPSGVSDELIKLYY